jgi:hypothetical protein
MAGSNLYSDQTTTSTGTVVFANLVTTAAQTTAINSAIAGLTPDQQVSTTLYTGALSGTPTNTTSGNVTVSPITTVNSIANKLCTLFIPVSITPTSGSTVVSLLVQLTGATLNNVISASFDSLKTGTDTVVMKDVSTNSTSNQLALTFGPNTTGAHTGVIRVVAVHA